MIVKEATARIKINKLLELAGWRFFADGKLPANIQLEPSLTIKKKYIDDFADASLEHVWGMAEESVEQEV
jgi:hypothetical protein